MTNEGSADAHPEHGKSGIKAFAELPRTSGTAAAENSCWAERVFQEKVMRGAEKWIAVVAAGALVGACGIAEAASHKHEKRKPRPQQTEEMSSESINGRTKAQADADQRALDRRDVQLKRKAGSICSNC